MIKIFESVKKFIGYNKISKGTSKFGTNTHQSIKYILKTNCHKIIPEARNFSLSRVSISLIIIIKNKNTKGIKFFVSIN